MHLERHLNRLTVKGTGDKAAPGRQRVKHPSIPHAGKEIDRTQQIEDRKVDVHLQDGSDDPDTWQDLQLSAEKAKKILSQRPKTPISVTHGGERVKMIVDWEKFEEITEDLL